MMTKSAGSSLDQTPEWACDVRRRWFSTPYSLSEKIHWLAYNTFGPSRKYEDLVRFVPPSVRLNPVSPKLTLAFIGDVMPIGRMEITISPLVRNFLENVDYLVGNFEGTLSSARKVFMAQAHTVNTVKFLLDLFPPEKIVLCCSNNHSGDFGWTEFNRSYQQLKTSGMRAIGRKDEPSVSLNGHVELTSATAWSNQPCNYVTWLGDIAADRGRRADFSVLCPHWGHELRLYPDPHQIRMSEILLSSWDMIVGHHSHTPQPVVALPLEDNVKVVAYSLGDFCTSLRMLKHYHHGIILKVSLGPGPDKNWRVGRLNWSFTSLKFRARSTAELCLSVSSPFHRFLYSRP